MMMPKKRRVQNVYKPQNDQMNVDVPQVGRWHISNMETHYLNLLNDTIDDYNEILARYTELHDSLGKLIAGVGQRPVHVSATHNGRIAAPAPAPPLPPPKPPALPSFPPPPPPRPAISSTSSRSSAQSAAKTPQKKQMSLNEEVALKLQKMRNAGRFKQNSISSVGQATREILR
jgi:hypothetical protein